MTPPPTSSESAGAAPAPANAATKTPARRRTRKPLSRRRLWLFRLIALIAIPVGLLGATELGMRIAGIGYPVSIFVPAEFGEGGLIRENPRFAWRYFPKSVARAPEAMVFEKQKPKDTVRIVVLGESAAQGDPEPAYSFARQLRAMLQSRYPGVNFEVLNAAVTAINSHAIVDIARDSTRVDADLYLVYIGNNEVVGAYGPGTVFAGISESRTLIRMQLWAKGLRLGQTIADAASAARAKQGETPGVWRGMEMFLRNPVTADDPRMDWVYSHFRANITDILDSLADSGRPAIVSTVAVNLRDCAPLGSVVAPSLSEVQRKEFEDLLAEGDKHLEADATAAARGAYEKARAIDGKHAGLCFRLAKLALAAGDSAGAASLFREALEQDTLRFRADAKENEIVREVAKSFSGRGIRLVDGERALEAAAPDRIPGEEFFWEHVHFTFRGNYELARAMWPAVVESLPAWAKTRAVGDVAQPPDEAEIRTRLGYSAFHEHRVIEKMLARIGNAPFTNQFGHDEQMGELRRRNSEIIAGGEKTLKEAETVSRRALEMDPNPEAYLLFNTSLLAIEQRDFPWVIDLLKRASAMAPQSINSVSNLARAYSALGRREESIVAWEKAIALAPENGENLNDYGIELGRAGRFAEALAVLDKAIRFAPENGSIHQNRGTTLVQLKRPAEAIAAFRTAISLGPTLLDARLNLAIVLKDSGQASEAIEQVRQLLQLNPSHAGGRALLAQLEGRPVESIGAEAPAGVALPGGVAPQAGAVAPGGVTAEELNNSGVVEAQKGNRAEARRRFEEAVRLKPDYVDALNNLGLAMMESGDIAGGLARFEAALKADPNHANAHFKTGLALRRLGRHRDALPHFQTASRISPNVLVIEREVGHTLMALERYEEAARAFRSALKAAPQSREATIELAQVLCQHDTGVPYTDAAREARRLLEPFVGAAASPSTPAIVLDVFALAWAATGDLAAGLGYGERALAKAKAEGQGQLAAQIEEHLAALRQNKPWTPPPAKK